jgi:hypothetical protein
MARRSRKAAAAIAFGKTARAMSAYGVRAASGASAKAASVRRIKARMTVSFRIAFELFPSRGSLNRSNDKDAVSFEQSRGGSSKQGPYLVVLAQIT